MKSMKSVKLFLFGIGAILTVLFAIAVSKPYNTVSAGSASVSPKSNSVNTDLTEDTAAFDSSTDLTENEVTVTVSQRETITTQTNTSAAQSQEQTVTNAGTTAPRETAKPTVPQTQKETTTKHENPTTASSSSDEPEQMTVYYTKTGKRYHYENPCGNGTFYPTTLADAKSRGLTPCQKCVLH